MSSPGAGIRLVTETLKPSPAGSLFIPSNTAQPLGSPDVIFRTYSPSTVSGGTTAKSSMGAGVCTMAGGALLMGVLFTGGWVPARPLPLSPQATAANRAIAMTKSVISSILSFNAVLRSAFECSSLLTT